jgi:hypothetical protein
MTSLSRFNPATSLPELDLLFWLDCGLWYFHCSLWRKVAHLGLLLTIGIEYAAVTQQIVQSFRAVIPTSNHAPLSYLKAVPPARRITLLFLGTMVDLAVPRQPRVSFNNMLVNTKASVSSTTGTSCSRTTTTEVGIG